MQISSWKRAYLSRFLSNEDFLVNVASFMELQLKEWDHNYEVYVLELKDYEFNVKNDQTYYDVIITATELEDLQREGPFSLDIKIWTELEKKGLTIIKGNGDYIDSIL